MFGFIFHFDGEQIKLNKLLDLNCFNTNQLNGSFCRLKVEIDKQRDRIVVVYLYNFPYECSENTQRFKWHLKNSCENNFILLIIISIVHKHRYTTSHAIVIAHSLGLNSEYSLKSVLQKSNCYGIKTNKSKSKNKGN